jgi:hypothetical protein
MRPKVFPQRICELRAAIGDLSKGRTGEGFDRLDKFGVIQEIADDADRLAAIAENATLLLPPLPIPHRRSPFSSCRMLPIF